MNSSSDIKNNNTGDVVYQLENLTLKINKIQKHITVLKKDFASKLSLYKLVAKRKKFLRYLERKNPERYQQFLKDSKLRVSSTKK